MRRKVSFGQPTCWPAWGWAAISSSNVNPLLVLGCPVLCFIHTCFVFLHACFVLLLLCLSFCVYVCFQIHCRSAMMPGTSWSPYYCAQLVCVLNFSEGLAVWWFYKQTNKQTKGISLVSSLQRQVHGSLVYINKNRKSKNFPWTWTRETLPWNAMLRPRVAR